MLAQRRLHRERHDGRGRARERDQDGGGIKPALMSGAEDRCEDLLGLGALHAAVPAADLAHHDGRSNRVLGAPVGRVDGGITEEREQRRGFDGQVGGEPPDGGDGRACGGEQVEHLLEQASPRDGEPVCGHLTGAVAIAERERVLETVLDACGKRTSRMIDLEQPTPA
jgi:hypothetical protein